MVDEQLGDGVAFFEAEDGAGEGQVEVVLGKSGIFMQVTGEI